MTHRVPARRPHVRNADLAEATDVDAAVAVLRRGGMVVVVDDDDRENEADLIASAETITAEQVAFMVRHSTGILCAPMSGKRVDKLQLPQMVEKNTDCHATAFTVTVDHVDAGTGVSAVDRTTTLRALASSTTGPEDLRRPGHIFPLRAREGGVLTRPGHTEAAVDLMHLAGLPEVGVIAEMVGDDGAMLRGAAMRRFASENGLPVLKVAELARYRRNFQPGVRRVSTADMPTVFGDFKAYAYRAVDGVEHLALVAGDPQRSSPGQQGVLVRIHSECLSGDIIGSLRCDCGGQLEQALAAIAEEGCGVVVYLRGHEGRGIGLGNKMKAYSFQERGYDTVDANTVQGLPVDSRNFSVGGEIIADLGIDRVRLITNNPDKGTSLESVGIEIVERVGLPSSVNPHNVRYLRTKRERMGHELHFLESGPKLSG